MYDLTYNCGECTQTINILPVYSLSLINNNDKLYCSPWGNCLHSCGRLWRSCGVLSKDTLTCCQEEPAVKSYRWLLHPLSYLLPQMTVLQFIAVLMTVQPLKFCYHHEWACHTRLSRQGRSGSDEWQTEDSSWFRQRKHYKQLNWMYIQAVCDTVSKSVWWVCMFMTIHSDAHRKQQQ